MYNKAVSHFRIHIQQKPQDSSLALLSCILSICIEFQQDSIANALALHAKDFKLLSSTDPATKTIKNESIIHELAEPFFARHVVLASTFGTLDWFSRVNNQVL